MPRKYDLRHQYKPNIYYWNLENGARRICAHYSDYPHNITRTISILVAPGEDMIAALNEAERLLVEARAEQFRLRRADEQAKQELIAKALISEVERDIMEKHRQAMERLARNTARARKDVDAVRARYGMADSIVYVNVYGEGVMS